MFPSVAGDTSTAVGTGAEAPASEAATLGTRITATDISAGDAEETCAGMSATTGSGTLRGALVGERGGSPSHASSTEMEANAKAITGKMDFMGWNLRRTKTRVRRLR